MLVVSTEIGAQGSSGFTKRHHPRLVPVARVASDRQRTGPNRPNAEKIVELFEELNQALAEQMPKSIRRCLRHPFPGLSRVHVSPAALFVHVVEK
jgi:hypothetical protein